jgi:hypothetical protein
MARKYDFNYGGARANYNQVAGVGQMVESGLARFGDMTQKIQDEETRLVTDAAFAEWRATGEIPENLDPKVNLEQFQGLINDSLTNDKLDEEIAKYQYENSEAFRDFQRKNQENQLENQRRTIELAQTRAEIARQELEFKQGQAEDRNFAQGIVRDAALEYSGINQAARQAGGQTVINRFLTEGLNDAEIADFVKKSIGVPLELNLLDPANSEALTTALEFMQSNAGIMNATTDTPEYRRAVAYEVAQEQASLLNDWSNRWVLAAGGNRDVIAGLGQVANLGNRSALGGGGANLLPGGGGSGGGSVGGAGSLGAGDPFTAVSDQDISRQALKDAGLSDSEIEGFEGYNGVTKRNLMKFAVDQRANPTMNEDDRAAEIERIKASSANQTDRITVVENIKDRGIIPVDLKPTTSSFDVAADVDFVDSDQRTFAQSMGNTSFDFGKGSNMSALKWDRKDTFANYLENMIGDIDFDESDEADGGDRKIIDQLQNLYENNFQENADMFKHFFYTWAMDSNKREDVFLFPNNVANALPKETPATIRAYFEDYKAAILKELGGDKEQVDGADANAGSYRARLRAAVRNQQ